MTLFKHVVDEEMPDAHVTEQEHKINLSKPFYEQSTSVTDEEKFAVYGLRFRL